MPARKEIEALREEAKKKERQLYRVNKEMTAWNGGKYQSHSNTKMSKLFIDNLRRQIADLNAKADKLDRENAAAK